MVTSEEQMKNIRRQFKTIVEDEVDEPIEKRGLWGKRSELRRWSTEGRRLRQDENKWIKKQQ